MNRWPRAPLGEICESRTGTRNPRNNPTDAFTYVDIASIDNGAKVIAEPKKLIGSEAPSRARRVIKANDVLVSMTRPNLNAVAMVPPELDDEICSTGFSVLRASTRILPEFVFHFVKTRDFIDAVSGAVSGAMYPAVTEEQVKGVALPLPPLAEQRRIVDILNRAAGIRRLRREAREKARQLIPALFVDMFGDPATNPKGWTVQPLAGLAKFISGATPSKNRESYWNGNIPWVSAKDMKSDPVSITEDCVTSVAISETNIKLIPKNSVLIVIRGMILAHTVPIRLTSRKLTINQDLKAVVPSSLVLPQYLKWSLQVMHAYLLGLVSTAAHGTKKIDMDRLRNLGIAVPPLPLQQAFAERVADIQATIAQQDRMAEAADRLRASLAARLFDGDGAAPA